MSVRVDECEECGGQLVLDRRRAEQACSRCGLITTALVVVAPAVPLPSEARTRRGPVRCPGCGGFETIRRGDVVLKTGAARRFACTACGSTMTIPVERRPLPKVVFAPKERRVRMGNSPTVPKATPRSPRGLGAPPKPLEAAEVALARRLATEYEWGWRRIAVAINRVRGVPFIVDGVEQRKRRVSHNHVKRLVGVEVRAGKRNPGARYRPLEDEELLALYEAEKNRGALRAVERARRPA